jgi:hypothetical protein
MKRVGPVLVILLCLGLSIGCKSPDSATVLSTWAGTFTDGANGPSGTISNWQFKSDNTTAGSWATTGTHAFSLSMNDSSYTLDSAGNLTGTATGSAKDTASGTTSNYSVTFPGTLGATTGNGTYTITFLDLSWPGPFSGTWNVTKQ